MNDKLILKSRHKLLNVFDELMSHKVLYAFFIPATLFVLVFNYRPMYGLIMAFQNYNILEGISGSQFIWFDNFKDFLSNKDFYRALNNTVILNALTITIVFPLPIIFAISISEFSLPKFKRVVQSITYLPHFLSWVIVAGLAYRILEQDTGIVNLFLEKIGIERIGFFREPSYFRGIFISINIWKGLGWSSILYLSAITAINPELYEAAVVDGASRFKRIWHITIPGIMPTISLLLILTISQFFSGAGAFEGIMALRNPMTASTSDIIDVYSYFRGIRMAQYGYATAIGFTQSILSVMLLFGANKGIKKITGHSLF